MTDHKNVHRAPIRPLDLPTLALTTGGLGFLRPAPGTWGSLPPVLAALLLHRIGASPAVSLGVALAWGVLASLACLWWGTHAEARFGRKDAAEVVADETAGVALPVTLAVAVPLPGLPVVWALVVAFLLFRLFDALKPWPVGALERLPGGWGVLADDLMAGVYAAGGLVALGWALG